MDERRRPSVRSRVVTAVGAGVARVGARAGFAVGAAVVAGAALSPVDPSPPSWPPPVVASPASLPALPSFDPLASPPPPPSVVASVPPVLVEPAVSAGVVAVVVVAASPELPQAGKRRGAEQKDQATESAYCQGASSHEGD